MAVVAGSGFVTLAATLSAIPTIPVAGLALLLGVDRFMAEARAITNLIGNVVATIVIADWDHALNRVTAQQVLSGDRPSPVVAVAVDPRRRGRGGCACLKAGRQTEQGPRRSGRQGR